jgi:hypothetical protein
LWGKSARAEQGIPYRQYVTFLEGEDCIPIC